ncbi:MAG: hypothetical protein IPO19_03365 [Rhodoferax sp.]|nr:hypothetical protein [Rhodoferax sp.]
MVLILLEALGALVLLLLIVWWTMFAGRPKGERPNHMAAPPAPQANTRPATGKPGEHG